MISSQHHVFANFVDSELMTLDGPQENVQATLAVNLDDDGSRPGKPWPARLDVGEELAFSPLYVDLQDVNLLSLGLFQDLREADHFNLLRLSVSAAPDEKTPLLIVASLDRQWFGPRPDRTVQGQGAISVWPEIQPTDFNVSSVGLDSHDACFWISIQKIDRCAPYVRAAIDDEFGVQFGPDAIIVTAQKNFLQHVDVRTVNAIVDAVGAALGLHCPKAPIPAELCWRAEFDEMSGDQPHGGRKA